MNSHPNRSRTNRSVTEGEFAGELDRIGAQIKLCGSAATQ